MSAERPENDSVFLQMSPWEFDQSPNGWRIFQITKEYVRAANLIRDYIAKNREKILNQTEPDTASMGLMHFHIGQLLASTGPEHSAEAIDAFNQSFEDNEECWNAYVSASIGFLENDEKKIDDAIKTVEASSGDKRSGNIGIMRNFKKALQMGERRYSEPYSWPRDAE